MSRGGRRHISDALRRVLSSYPITTEFNGGIGTTFYVGLPLRFFHMFLKKMIVFELEYSIPLKISLHFEKPMCMYCLILLTECLVDGL